MDNSSPTLQAGITELGLEVSDEQQNLLLAFVRLIEKWNKSYNLTAIRSREEILQLHILDSLAILPFVSGEKIIDVGTGAGLPGIPLAILMSDVQFTLVDSNSKKTRFVRQVVLELQLQNIEVVHSRIESLGRDEEYDLVLSRAFASLSEIINLTEYLLHPEGVLLAMKGQVPESELKKINRVYSVSPIVVPGVEAERCVVRVNKT